jgi:hypothetical protein
MVAKKQGRSYTYSPRSADPEENSMRITAHHCSLKAKIPMCDSKEPSPFSAGFAPTKKCSNHYYYRNLYGDGQKGLTEAVERRSQLIVVLTETVLLPASVN